MICPICSSSDTSQFHDRVWSSADAVAYRCHQCRTGFLDPMMTPEEEKLFYAAYNEHTKKRGVTVTKDSAELHTKSIPEAQLRWERLKRFFISGSNVLEVGSSTGAFLELCMRSCRCACVEPDADNRRFAAQFASETYEYIENVSAAQQFDIICLFHVFEHIREPFQFLRTCHGLLRIGGLIMIEVPHVEDPLISIYDVEAYKDFYFQPMHHYIYSEKGLDWVFKSSGFSKRQVMFIQRYGLDNHLAWLKNRKPGGDRELRALFGKCNQSYCRALEDAGKTDTIMFIAEKDKDIQ